MTPSKQDPGGFPHFGMAYEDRFRMTVRNFGRKVVIEVNRGRAVASADGKVVTITYRDSATRKARKPAKKREP
jgi:hypothetical protein